MYDTFDTAITVYCHSYDAETRADMWTRFPIGKASWYGGQKAAVGDSGLSTADAYTVRIPAAYVPEGFAPGNGDIVVRGLQEMEIAKAVDATRLENSFVITGVYDNRRGVPALRHIRIEGK